MFSRKILRAVLRREERHRRWTDRREVRDRFRRARTVIDGYADDDGLSLMRDSIHGWLACGATGICLACLDTERYGERRAECAELLRYARGRLGKYGFRTGWRRLPGFGKVLVISLR